MLQTSIRQSCQSSSLWCGQVVCKNIHNQWRCGPQHLPFPFKRMGTRIPRCPSRGHYAVTLDRGMNNLNYPPMWVLIHPITWLLLNIIIISPVYFQGLTLLELAAHLEGKAARLRHEGLGKVKGSSGWHQHFIPARYFRRVFWSARPRYLPIYHLPWRSRSKHTSWRCNFQHPREDLSLHPC